MQQPSESLARTGTLGRHHPKLDVPAAERGKSSWPIQTIRGSRDGSITARILLAVLLLAGCGGAPTSYSSAKKLAARVIAAPNGYQLDRAPGAVGQISPALFATYGGDAHLPKDAFVAGFKANYINSDTDEGISVTILQFRSAADANKYLVETAPKTLSYAAATHQAYPSIPGAIEVDGTQAYDGEYSHGVVMSRGRYYAQVVYVIPENAPAPVELKVWAEGEYSKLV